MSGSESTLPIEQTQTNLNWTTGYRGELMINPDTGEILRLTLHADLVRLPLDRADLMVLYARTQIVEPTTRFMNVMGYLVENEPSRWWSITSRMR